MRSLASARSRDRSRRGGTSSPVPEHGVIEAWHLGAAAGDGLAVERRDHDAVALGALADHRAPWVGDQRVAVALALLAVAAPLRRRDDPGLILDGAGAQ